MLSWQFRVCVTVCRCFLSVYAYCLQVLFVGVRQRGVLAMESLRVVVIILAISSIGTAQSEKNCNLPSVSNLEKLISDALIAGDAPTRPTIVLMGAPHYLCQASGTCRGTYSGLSLLANYTCSGAAACRGGNPSQFDFACASGEWSISVGSTTVFSFIEIPEANSTVETRTDCGLCYNPALLQTADRLTHCVGKR